MIDQHPAISGQHSALTGNMHPASDNNIRKTENGNHTSDVDNQKKEFKKVAKEMESLFAYQLLKIMRESTANMTDDKKENGNDTYMSLFDIEVSKLFADRGLGMQDSIINWLERSQGISDNEFNS